MNTSLRTPGVKSLTELVGVALFLAFLTLPLFWSTLRQAVFSTIPYDDYAPYLMYLIGKNPSFELMAPFHYRVLSVLPASLLIDLPLVPFSRLPQEISRDWLIATQSLVLWNWLCVVIAAATIVLYLRCAKNTLAIALLGATLTVFGAQYLTLTSVDGPFVAALAVLALCSARYPVFFAIGVCVSALINEKLPFIFAALYAGRIILRDIPFSAGLVRLLPSVCGLGIYFALIHWISLPGNSAQLELFSYPAAIAENIAVSFSARGVMLNIIPGFIALTAAIYACKQNVQSIAQNQERNPHVYSAFFASRALIVPPVLLAGAALAAQTQFNVGRIMLLALPLCIPAMVQRIAGENRAE